MNQSPPRQRTVRSEPPALVRRQVQRRNLMAAAPMQQRAIIHPPILRVPTFNRNDNNAETVAYMNANRLNNFNSNSNNNMRIPATKRRRINGNANKNKKNRNKTTRKTQSITIHKLPK